MKNKISALFTAAVVTGLMAGNTAKAEEKAGENHGDKMAAEKNNCKGMKGDDKNSCKGMKEKKKADKNSCKNGCGGGMDHSADKKADEKKDK